MKRDTNLPVSVAGALGATLRAPIHPASRYPFHGNGVNDVMEVLRDKTDTMGLSTNSKIIIFISIKQFHFISSTSNKLVHLIYTSIYTFVSIYHAANMDAATISMNVRQI